MKTFKEFLNEVKVTKKDRVGKGTFHVVYPYIKNQDAVIKTSKMGHSFNLSDPNAWFNIFKRFPKYFANVYKTHPNYIIVEKLDVNKAFLEITEMETELYKIPSIVMEIEDTPGQNVTEFLANKTGRDLKEELLDKVKDKALFNKWINFIKVIQDLNLRAFIDFNDNNFGYDKDGNLKMLDI